MQPTLDSTLKQLNRAAEERAAQQKAARLGLEYANLSNHPFGLEALRIISFEQTRDFALGVYVHTADRTRVATTRPDDPNTVEILKQLATHVRGKIEVMVVSETSFAALLKAYAKLIDEDRRNQDAQRLAAEHRAAHDYVHQVHTIEDLAKFINDVSVTEALDVIIAAGFNQGASDIHLEPAEAVLIVRFRIDGVLQKVIELPSKFQAQIISRIRLLANLKLDGGGNIQDGRFTMVDNGVNADFRVSVVPTGYGPGVVLRILRRDTEAISLEQLGFTQANLDRILRAIRRPYGMILVTGPTGSGKSTSLYALLRILNTPERKIITIEDPIEYRIPGIQQSQTNNETGYTFAEALKGSLRQDPDVVMVGEIRDPETATIALNASLTGHLVLSTLHTNDAITAPSRLLELGVEPFLLSGSISAVIAQRLVRKVVPGSDPKAPVYKGRVVISEVLIPTPEFERAVSQHADQATLVRLAQEGGMITMLDDGLAKVKQGITTEEEIYRVTI
jgi:type IV pilus assembly protein PilB